MTILETLNVKPTQLISITELEKSTGLNNRTIRRAIADGTINAFTTANGGKYLIPAKELEKLFLPVRPAA